jgi:hypothetical protein
MKKIFSIIFLFVFIASNNIFSMLNFELKDDFLIFNDSSDDLGEFSGLDEFFIPENQNDFINEIVPEIEKKEIFIVNDNTIINKIIELQKERLGEGRKKRTELESGLIIRLFEISNGFLSKNISFSEYLKTFLKYLISNDIKITYDQLKSLFRRFVVLSDNKKQEKRDKVDAFLTDPFELSEEMEFVLNNIIKLQKIRLNKSAKIRSFIEVGLIIKLFEIIYEPIIIDLSFNVKEFYDLLLANGVRIKYQNLTTLLDYFKNISEEKRYEKRLVVDKFLKKIKSPTNDTKIKINKILELQKDRCQKARKVRTEAETALIICLYEDYDVKICDKASLDFRGYCSFLNDVGIKIKKTVLASLLQRFKRYSKERKNSIKLQAQNVLKDSNKLPLKVEFIIDRILKLDLSNLQSSIKRGFLIKLYESVYGEIKKNEELRSKEFFNFLKDYNLFSFGKFNKDKKNYNYIRSLLYKFKKLPKEKKVKERVEINELL